jgi:hypothetical protein
MFPGLVAALAFQECRLAYMHGLYLASIALAQLCTEPILHGYFRMAARDDLDGAGFAGLREREISRAEFLAFDKLRRLRNTCVHARAPWAPDGIGARIVQLRAHPEGIYRRDALAAMRALHRLCNRRPTALH